MADSADASPILAAASAADAGPILADVAIVGAGLVGAALAIGLARAGISVVVVDQAPEPQRIAPGTDGRGIAVALGSRRMLEALGAWGRAAPVAGAIEEIRVSDGPSSLFLHFDRRAVGDDPCGWIVEAPFLRWGLAEALTATPGARLICPAEVRDVGRDAGRAWLDLADGRRVQASLVVGADGRGSAVRRAAGIRSFGWPYRQVATVFAVRTELPHRNIAHERFRGPGPFALLPMGAPDLASIVWVERPEETSRLEALDDQTFGDLATARFGGAVGRMRVQGRRWRWPLSLHLAERWTAPRLALVGDAAHGIHPISGQGANLGWRDAAALAQVLVEARRAGEDLGDERVLARYVRWRRADTLAMIAATDGLNRLFATELPPVRWARDLGLAAVHRMPRLKAAFMREAMGLSSRLPKLARGESL